MTNHRRQIENRVPVTHNQWLLLCLLGIAAGIALGWCLRQIRQEREQKERPVPVQEWPAPADGIRSVPGGIYVEV